MQKRSLIVWILAGLLIGLAPWGAIAQANADLKVDVVCPLEQAANTTAIVTLIYENSSCFAVPVRTMSSIVGNSNQTLGGIGVFGPVVIDDRAVAAGTGQIFCGCSAGSCDCDFANCSSDAECSSCETAIPHILNVEKSAAPVLSLSLQGTVATYIFISEFESGEKTSTELNECLVDVQ